MPFVTANNSFSDCTVGAFVSFFSPVNQQIIEEVSLRWKWYSVVPPEGAH